MTYSSAYLKQKRFTIGDAARKASPEYVSQHWAKVAANGLSIHTYILKLPGE